MTKIIFLTLFVTLLSASYLTNKSCSECHEEIFQEYQSSYHSKTYFNDELHRKVANLAASEDHYNCATYHMPSAQNQKELANGTAKPNSSKQREKDVISCFYCHQIAYVKKAHLKNKIIPTKQVENYKSTLYGSLKNPDESDKHTMTHFALKVFFRLNYLLFYLVSIPQKRTTQLLLIIILSFLNPFYFYNSTVKIQCKTNGNICQKRSDNICSFQSYSITKDSHSQNYNRTN